MSEGDKTTFGITAELAEGTVPMYGILVISYFDAEGTSKYGVIQKGECHLDSALGLLELAKGQLLRVSE